MTRPDGISVILSTWNRADHLRKSLTAYLSLTPPKLPWELIVVDNNSTDHTREVVEEFAGKLPITYAFEALAGQCEARNHGILNSTYNILLFTDDDITPSSNWLLAYSETITQNPDISFFGGAIVVDSSDVNVPDWALDNGELRDWLKTTFGNFTEQSAKANPGLFYGGNMAYHYTLFDKYGLFDPRLGHAKGKRLAAEETFFQKRLIEGGEKSLYVGDASVAHRIMPEEIQVKKRVAYHKWHGRGKALMNYMLKEDTPINLSRTFQTLMMTPKNLLRILIKQDQFVRVFAMCKLTILWNYEYQMLRTLIAPNEYKVPIDEWQENHLRERKQSNIPKHLRG